MKGVGLSPTVHYIRGLAAECALKLPRARVVLQGYRRLRASDSKQVETG